MERTEEPSAVTETIQDTPEDALQEIGSEGISEEEEPVSEPIAVVVAEEESPDETVPPPEPSKKIRRSRVFFVNVDENGGVTLKGILRPVYYIDSPLTDTLRSLLQGLSADDVRDGLLSLVPEGTELRGIAIREGTAYIDFNESFRFNSFGSEGYKSQLQQIVFTATEFQTVKSVQFLVNGERISYLGPESPYVGDPLSRGSL